VERALAGGDLVGARALVGLHLVSRDTGALDESHVVSATVESLAENVGDSVVAPLAFYLGFGLAGAAVYRAVNTADAMLGYREGVLEHFGKVAARLDDVLNLIPARLAGLAIVAGAAAAGGDGRNAWRVLRRDARATASPNAGWPMAAMAGALGVALEKPGAYRLGDGPPPALAAIARAIRIVGAAIAVAAFVLVAVALVLFLTDGSKPLGIMGVIAAATL
jgi:adenosylcobinamide-phosphate synthase